MFKQKMFDPKIVYAEKIVFISKSNYFYIWNSLVFSNIQGHRIYNTYMYLLVKKKTLLMTQP
jgi:hypothetical protein